MLNQFTNEKNLTAFFSNSGHFLMHYMAAMYFTIILSLQKAWEMNYEQLFGRRRERAASPAEFNHYETKALLVGRFDYLNLLDFT